MKTLLLLFLTFLCISTYAQKDTVDISSEIKNVTVFLQGAEVNREIKTNLKAGKQVLLQENLPTSMDAQSIDVEAISDCQILGVRHFNSEIADFDDISSIKSINDKIEDLYYERKLLMQKLLVMENEKSMLKSNEKLGSQTQRVSIDELKKGVDFYRDRFMSIEEEILSINKKAEQIKDQQIELSKKKQDIIQKVQTSKGNLLLELDCDKYAERSIRFSYFINNAVWSPSYDFRAQDDVNELAIVYNANISQSSGEDWKNVQINLSSANPVVSATKPELIKWNINSNYGSTTYENYEGGPDGQLIGMIRDYSSYEPIPFANIIVKKNGIQKGGTVSDFDGQYRISPLMPGAYDVEVSYVGYTTKTYQGVVINIAKTTNLNLELRSESKTLEEDVIIYAEPLIDADNTTTGSKLSSKEISRIPTRNISSIASTQAGAASNNTINYGQRKTSNIKNEKGITSGNEVTQVNYSIESKNTILSNGSVKTVKIKEARIPIEYVYQSVPKANTAFFLTCELLDWDKLNFLSGPSSIYLNGTYTGNSFIDANSTKDTLTVSLGEVKNLTISRNFDTKLNDRAYIGNNYKEKIGVILEAKNNGNKKVNVRIQDQIPVSELKSVSVELLEKGGAKYNEKKGFLEWNFPLDIGESKKLNFSYEVKYPSGLNIQTK